jgi:hypothetical protein
VKFAAEMRRKGELLPMETLLIRSNSGAMCSRHSFAAGAAASLLPRCPAGTLVALDEGP